MQFTVLTLCHVMTIYFMFKNVTPFAVLTSCHCSLPSPDACVLLSVWSVPYLNHAAVPAYGLGSVQRSEGPANTADGAASRYLECVAHFLLQLSYFAHKSLSCPLWMSIQASQFKSAHFPSPGKIMERLMSSVWKSDRSHEVKPTVPSLPSMHAKHGLHN